MLVLSCHILSIGSPFPSSPHSWEGGIGRLFAVTSRMRLRRLTQINSGHVGERMMHLDCSSTGMLRHIRSSRIAMPDRNACSQRRRRVRSRALENPATRALREGVVVGLLGT